MPTESRHELLKVAMQNTLAALAGWLPPDRVLCAEEFTEQCLDESLTTIYTMAPDEEENEEETFTSTRSQMHVDLALATKVGADADNPYTAPDPTRWTLQNRLAEDAIKALRANRTLIDPQNVAAGALALHLQIPIVDRTAERTFHPGWAIVLLRVVILYDYQDTVP